MLLEMTTETEAGLRGKETETTATRWPWGITGYLKLKE